MADTATYIASVVVYSDGGGALLTETLASLARQTVPGLEVVVSAGSSNVDANPDPMQTAVQAGPIVRNVPSDTALSPARRNCAVETTSGLYILELVAGDEPDSTMLEKCIWALETRPAVGAVVVGPQRDPAGDLRPDFADASVGPGGPTVGAITQGSVVYRRAGWRQVGGFDEASPPSATDAECCLKMADRGWKATCIQEDLIHRAAVRSFESGDVEWLRARHASFFEAADRLRRRRARWERTLSGASPVGGLARRLSMKIQAEGLEDSRQWLSHPVRSSLHFLPERLKGAWWTGLGLPKRADTWDEIPPLVDLPRGSILQRTLLRTGGGNGRTRVLFLHPYLISGGAETVLLNILTYIDRERFEAHLVTTESARAEWLWMNNPRHCEFAAQTDRIYHLQAFLDRDYYLRFVFDLIESRAIDVLVVSLSIFGYNALPQIRSRFPDLAIMDLLHAEAPYASRDHITLASRYGPLMDRRIVVSESVALLQVSKYGETPERVVVIPNGIDTRDAYDPARHAGGEFRRRVGIAEDVSIVLFFGRIAMEKQPMHIVEVAERMRGRDDVAFVLIGDGAEKPAVEAEVARRGLGNVIVCPPQEDVAPALADARVVLFPSKREGLPMSGIEAMSMGVPVVASRVPGWTDVVTDGVEGFLVDDGDIDGYVAAVTRLAVDDVLHGAMAASGRKRAVRDYDVRESVRRWETVLAETAEMKAGRT
jgi:glycosyltransferase involved in cell wall biosynthesis